MGSRRFILALVASTVVLTTVAGPTLAKRPEPPPESAPAGERPLTAQEQAASNRKEALAEAYVAREEARGGDLVPLACVVGVSADADVEATGTDPASAAVPGGEAAGDEGIAADPAVGPTCVVAAQGFIAVEARDQLFGHYCGPAVGQVIGNYSWAMPAGANKYTQGQIAGWMSTDINGQTGAFAMEFGLEKATGGSPRRPANWDWIVTTLVDSDRDGWFGDQLHAYVRSNISNSKMPLAIPVKPHDAKSPTDSNLASWPRAVASVGHWVGIYGWTGTYDGTDSARMYYTDSSRDEGGATGKFWTPTRRFTFMILEHTGRFVW